jgi:class 3 adenylate cyclase
VEATGGTVVQLLGDGVLCAFGVPRIAEDDALRAVRAAIGDPALGAEVAYSLPARLTFVEPGR